MDTKEVTKEKLEAAFRKVIEQEHWKPLKLEYVIRDLCTDIIAELENQ